MCAEMPIIVDSGVTLPPFESRLRHFPSSFCASVFVLNVDIIIVMYSNGWYED